MVVGWSRIPGSNPTPGVLKWYRNGPAIYCWRNRAHMLPAKTKSVMPSFALDGAHNGGM